MSGSLATCSPTLAIAVLLIPGCPIRSGVGDLGDEAAVELVEVVAFGGTVDIGWARRSRARRWGATCAGRIRNGVGDRGDEAAMELVEVVA